MKKSVFLIILMICCSISAAAKDLTYLSTEDFKKKVFFFDLSENKHLEWKYIGDKPCLIDFSTTWCGWCKKLHPILEQIAEQYDGQIYVYTVDADKEPELAALFAVSGYPTVVLCPMTGSPQKVAGYNPLEFWQEAILQVFGIAKP
jgi:thiol-disulfide isomerase/thioredoxin